MHTLSPAADYGEIVEVKLHKKGAYGFVRFSQHSDAVKAIVSTHSILVEGRVSGRAPACDSAHSIASAVRLCPGLAERCVSHSPYMLCRRSNGRLPLRRTLIPFLPPAPQTLKCSWGKASMSPSASGNQSASQQAAAAGLMMMPGLQGHLGLQAGLLHPSLLNSHLLGFNPSAAQQVSNVR